MNISSTTLRSIEKILEMVRDGNLDELQSNRTIALSCLVLDSLSDAQDQPERLTTSLISDEERDALLSVFAKDPGLPAVEVHRGMSL